ncbi:phenylacetate-CoA oxygenase subunit PaaC [Paenibacillus melissococcoides]|uniref:Phenylacetate-CoA oxygenase subunit PaaC n=1 Tax=Paenibacillus melissococcoides TaxID=2912268 RepID=A0ABN8U9S6_9BACL|nr:MULTISPECIES: 1,2-phenylacetyl-CoA epoxidase subunit PaaC [Paenibacillus]MEB9897428.1 phenylacetate-CoA oxygenase subunit PaaC [Bacillus cereus]CAH8247865.1 phenylacetate-CoA oxygenase subunit PaaC [Paenibacillus melissococcoides]CAH8719312.1 phenylacetate-CoA oxygenase subunit PaaC [Paenibacillus melissococcoides]CAH8720323.1 phenylacetate-CoA oxygenase subunit PaaC [Paenibacillus melissococcoides]GIO78849.1 phenylacetic acid degradation protein [Paenibacillus dendritiformis]
MAEHIGAESAEEANRSLEYARALQELLFQIADDDYILAYRGSEWLGLAPHIEEDVAFSSMAQDMMGHAAMLYGMLEELGAGKADDLAHLRSPEAFRNAILVERPNGPGEYADEPHYDWAYAIARCCLYGLFKDIRLEALTRSSYVPLAQTAGKMRREHHYHRRYWRSWFTRLADSTDEARLRLNAAVAQVWSDVGSLFPLGSGEEAIVRFGLSIGGDELAWRWKTAAQGLFEASGLAWPGDWAIPARNGRDGQHTDDLARAVATLSEVYRIDPAAGW